MMTSPSVEIREVLLPSMDIVDGNLSRVVSTTREDHCIGASDGAGIPVISTILI